jgi:hypothetical protein
LPLKALADGRASFFFESACRVGHLDTVKWLVHTFGLLDHDAECDFGHGFANACSSGRLDVAKWMARSLNVKVCDAAYNEDWDVCSAAEYGGLNMVRWLVEELQYPADEIDVDPGYPKDALWISIDNWLRARGGKGLTENANGAAGAARFEVIDDDSWWDAKYGRESIVCIERRALTESPFECI